MESSRVLNKSHRLRRVRETLANRYLRIGLILLVLATAAVILVLNNMLMPRYTRADAAFSMPLVEGLAREAAVETLQAYRLGAAQWDTVLDFSVERGTILAQSPLAGAQVKPGRTVYLKESDNTRDSVRVPNVVSATISAATNMIRRAGLVVGAVLPDSIPTPYADVVTRQHPPADSVVLRLDSVTIWFSTGLGYRLVEVPQMVGLPVQHALQLLRGMGLHATVYPQLESDGQNPTVLNQSQPPGTRVQEGSELTLFWESDGS